MAGITMTMITESTPTTPPTIAPLLLPIERVHVYDSYYDNVQLIYTCISDQEKECVCER